MSGLSGLSGFKLKEGVMKTIVVKWVPEEFYPSGNPNLDGKAMQVVESNHERFAKESRFNFGFFNIATDEGYTIISLPMEDGNGE